MRTLSINTVHWWIGVFVHGVNDWKEFSLSFSLLCFIFLLSLLLSPLSLSYLSLLSLSLSPISPIHHSTLHHTSPHSTLYHTLHHSTLHPILNHILYNTYPYTTQYITSLYNVYPHSYTGDPANNKEISTDPFKTLFVARIVSIAYPSPHYTHPSPFSSYLLLTYLLPYLLLSLLYYISCSFLFSSFNINSKIKKFLKFI